MPLCFNFHIQQLPSRWLPVAVDGLFNWCTRNGRVRGLAEPASFASVLFPPKKAKTDRHFFINIIFDIRDDGWDLRMPRYAEGFFFVTPFCSARERYTCRDGPCD